MPSRNKNFIILPKSWSGHGRTDRTGSAGPVLGWLSSFPPQSGRELPASEAWENAMSLQWSINACA